MAIAAKPLYTHGYTRIIPFREIGDQPLYNPLPHPVLTLFLNRLSSFIVRTVPGKAPTG